MNKISLYVLIIIFSLGFINKASAQNKRDSIPEKPPEVEKLEPIPVKLDFDTTAAPNDDFTKDIVNLMETMHSLNIGKQFAEILQGSKKDELNDFQKKFYSRLLNSFTQGEGKKIIMNAFVKIYRANFTHDEVKQLLAFYKTPVGNKMITALPEVLIQSTTIGGKIGKYLGEKIYNEMVSEGNKN